MNSVSTTRNGDTKAKPVRLRRRRVRERLRETPGCPYSPTGAFSRTGWSWVIDITHLRRVMDQCGAGRPAAGPAKGGCGPAAGRSGRGDGEALCLRVLHQGGLDRG